MNDSKYRIREATDASIDPSRLHARAIRFQEHLEGNARSKAHHMDDHRAASACREVQTSMDRVVGTSQQLEKSYFRLTSAARADQVRPTSVLASALQHILTGWANHQLEYSYASEQLKSIRQDLQVQGIGASSRLAFDVYEAHARMALQHHDVGEWVQCLSVLKSMYIENPEVGRIHAREFLAYRILYAIYSGSLLDVRLMLRASLQNTYPDLYLSMKHQHVTNEVQHALQVVKAVAMNDYHRFSNLYMNAPNFGAYIMDLFAPRIQSHTVQVMASAYRPGIPIAFISEEIAMERFANLSETSHSRSSKVIGSNDAQDTKERAKGRTLEFLRRHGAFISEDQLQMDCREKRYRQLRTPGDIQHHIACIAGRQDVHLKPSTRL